MAPKHFAPVWQHYERHEPTGRSKHHRAICKFCGYELSGQPERMKTHLQRCSGCPQAIKDEYALEESSGASSQNKFAISTAAMEFEHAVDDESPEPPMHRAKRRRSMEVASGAEGLAGLPWAPTANASAIAPAPSAVPPAFQPPYAPTVATETVVTAPHRPAMAMPAGQMHQTPRAQPSAAQGPLGSSSAGGPARHHDSASFLGVYDNVRGYYSRLTPMNKMQTSIGPTISPHPIIRAAIAKVPKAVRERFYGCGMPLPTGIEGLRVLDLGCGAGRDCYVAARLVGRSGEVIGVDMTDEQLRVASEFVPEYARTLGYQPHLKFVKGYIEFLSQLPELYPGSIDLCISNNAVNLSPNKELVLRSVFEILKEGGEFQFSDIYADRRLPNHVRSHPVLMGECLGGALYTEDFKRLCQRVGFMDARQVSAPAPVRIESPELRDLVGATQFSSITFRLFKFARPASVLEPSREDYGQVAVYRGTIDGQRARTRFDNTWAFEAHRPVLVDGNTAVMLGESWLRRHFEVRGDRSLHFGSFTSSAPPVQYEPWETDHETDDPDDPDDPADSRPRRPGILPLPTPYFINGLRQQGAWQQGQAQMQSALQALGADKPRPPSTTYHSQSVSRRSSPSYEQPQQQQQAAPPPPPPQSQQHHTQQLPQPASATLPPITSTGTLASASRDHHPTQFPRLASFSISQSNVRADGAIARSTASGTSLDHFHQSKQSTNAPRFVLPVARLSATQSSTSSKMAVIHDSHSAPATAVGGGSTSVLGSGSSPSVRSTGSPITPLDFPRPSNSSDAGQPDASQLHLLVYAFLLQNNYGRTAKAFARICSSIVNGEPKVALDLLSTYFRSVLIPPPSEHPVLSALPLRREFNATLLRFRLDTQHYVELIAGHQELEALIFGQRTLWRYPDIFDNWLSHTVPPNNPPGQLDLVPREELKAQRAEIMQHLTNVAALVAYPDPRKSTLAYLLEPERRRELADAVNRAILEALKFPKEPALVILARQLATTSAYLVGYRASANSSGSSIPSANSVAPGIRNTSASTDLRGRNDASDRQQQQQPWGLETFINSDSYT
ncbi:hypothetical protein GGI07_004479 [Coemansia sp. Benny D115]|nr:hypothetical protein GGI07_004479 [Coemansia sp. Benny D115]